MRQRTVGSIVHPRLKVLYLIGTLEVGGAEGQLAQLASNLDRERFEPVVYCLARGGPLAQTLRERGVRVEVIGLRMRQFPRSALKTAQLVWMVARERPAILHGFLYAGYVLGALIAFVTRVPVMIASRRSLGNYKAGSRFMLRLERLANRFTKVVIANSAAVRADVIRQERLDGEKVIVIYNGVATSSRVTDPAALRRSLDIHESAPVVAVLANFIHYKGHLTFLEAWRVVVEKVPGAVVLLIGDGVFRPKIEAAIAQLDLARSVRILGQRSDAREIVSAVDLLVHPSFEEGFSNAILEAMAEGRPVVATAVGGNVEAVIDGVTGCLVRVGDATELASAIVRLLGDSAARSSFGAAGRERARTLFAIDKMVEAYERVYMSAVAELAPPGSHEAAPSSARKRMGR